MRWRHNTIKAHRIFIQLLPVINERQTVSTCAGMTPQRYLYSRLFHTHIYVYIHIL